MHHVSQTLSTSDDDACKTLNEVKVVNLVTVTRCRHTTYFKNIKNQNQSTKHLPIINQNMCLPYLKGIKLTHKVFF